MALIPVGERVLVEPIAPARQTTGGVLIPDQKRMKDHEWGKVVALSWQLTNSDEVSKVAEDNIVLYGVYSGDRFKDENGKDLVILSVDEILVIKEEE